MARSSEVGSATAQFFLATADNIFLDHTGRSEQAFGAAVFAAVVDGMEGISQSA